VSVSFGSFLLLIFSGAPMVFALGVAAALTLALTTTVPMTVVAQRLYAGLDSFTIMAIPFFVLAGLIMEEGGIARRIINLAAALVGWITGSLFMVAVVTGAGLAAISGSGSADTAAIASMLTPEMRKRRYDIDFSAALIAAAGALGPIIPPSIIMVVVASISNLSVGAMFLGGVVPGLLMAFGMLVAAYWFARRGGEIYRDSEPFSAVRLGRAFVAALPALTMPAIIVGGILGGVFTPTEAAAIAVLVGLVVSLFIYRELAPADLPRLVLRAAGISAAVVMIIGTASIFSWLIAAQNVQNIIAAWIIAHAGGAWTFLLLVNLLLLLVGMFMESISAILILMPVLMPIAIKLGVDPVHFGVICSVNLSIGLITPPYGICLFVASTVVKRTVGQVASRVWIPLAPMFAVLLAATYVPELVLWLPTTFIPK
jgi:C4-dicarboxylate transporter, DctM subunit